MFEIKQTRFARVSHWSDEWSDLKWEKCTTKRPAAEGKTLRRRARRSQQEGGWRDKASSAVQMTFPIVPPGQWRHHWEEGEDQLQSAAASTAEQTCGKMLLLILKWQLISWWMMINEFTGKFIKVAAQITRSQCAHSNPAATRYLTAEHQLLSRKQGHTNFASCWLNFWDFFFLHSLCILLKIGFRASIVPHEAVWFSKANPLHTVCSAWLLCSCPEDVSRTSNTRRQVCSGSCRTSSLLALMAARH